MEDDQADRIIGAIRAHRLIMQGLAAQMLLQLPDPPRAALELRDIISDRFVDEPTSSNGISREREAKINHYAAHFAEDFWTDVAEGLEAQKTKQS